MEEAKKKKAERSSAAPPLLPKKTSSRPPSAKTSHAKELTKTGQAKVDNSEDGSEDLASEDADDRLSGREQYFDSMKDKMLFNINSKIKIEIALRPLFYGSHSSTAMMALEDPEIRAMNFSEEEEL